MSENINLESINNVDNIDNNNNSSSINNADNIDHSNDTIKKDIQDIPIHRPQPQDTRVIIKCLPFFKSEELTPILNEQHVYPISIKMLGGPMKGTAFLDFSTNTEAHNAIEKLHGFQLLNKILKAEVVQNVKKSKAEKKINKMNAAKVNNSNNSNNNHNNISNSNNQKNVNKKNANHNQSTEEQQQNQSTNNPNPTSFMNSQPQNSHHHHHHYFGYPFYQSSSHNGGTEYYQNYYTQNTFYNNGDGSFKEYSPKQPSKQETIGFISKLLDGHPDFYQNVLELMKQMNLQFTNFGNGDGNSSHFSISSPISSTQSIQQKRKHDSIETLDITKEINNQQPALIKNVKEMKEEEEDEDDDDESKDMDYEQIKLLNELFPGIPETTAILKKQKLRQQQQQTKQTNNISYQTKHVTPTPTQIESHNQSTKQSIIQFSLKPQSISLTINTTENNDNDDEFKKDMITLDEINTNKEPQDIKVGEPSNKIYIKNLSKKVTEQELKNIYKRYFNNANDMNQGLVINHFKTGKLRNQAFVTFPTIELAVRALYETQGYKLLDKPFQIQFSKGSV
ncbi:hypothetical protein CYY_005194 [Polysphondylium violaceum]|uniref:RRM domain-containing protein n=1 Tax=Polysphondylium violaceum TaxID=133409 RepID=A0A8J4UYR8_9MYCE|nr:hypothetical protein CYY_005194 [Polysphondylium violaceum]